MSKKERFRTGLLFGIGMMIFFIIGNLIKADEITGKEILKTMISAIIGGAFAGTIFGWLIGITVNSKSLDKATRIDLAPGEFIEFESPANHIKNFEAVGGKLYLTNSRLVFKSHKFNFQNHLLSIDLTEIVKTERFKNFGIIDNGLLVVTKDNSKEKFVVYKPVEWAEKFITTI